MQHLGPLDIIIVWAASAYLLRNRFHGNTSLTISKHASLEGFSHLYFGILEVIVAAVFYWFLIAWFIPTLGLPSIYLLVSTIGLAGLALAGVIPDKPGIKSLLHGIAAYTMAVCMIIMVLGIVVFAQLPLWLTVLGWLSVAIMTFGAVGLALNIRYIKDRLLYYQLIYIMLFHIMLILATYFHL